MFAKYLMNFLRVPKLPSKFQDGRVLLQEFRCLSIKSDDTLKSPRTPYLIFSNDKMPELRKSHPDIRVSQMSKMIGQMWRSMSEDEKNPFRERYQEEKSIFLKQQSGEERMQALQERREKRLKKKMKKLKLQQKEQGKPVARGLNPYVLFATSKMIERGDASLKMYIMGVSDMWKKMTDEDKKPFVDQARKNSVEYQREMYRWEQKMIQSGQEGLLSEFKLRKHKASAGQVPLKAAGVKRKSVRKTKGAEGGEKGDEKGK